MKIILALVLILCLIASCYSEQINNQAQVSNNKVHNAANDHMPWFVQNHEVDDLRTFLTLTLTSMENVINPNGSVECMKAIAIGTKELLNMTKGSAQNIGTSIAVVTQIHRKCNFDLLLNKFIGNLNFVLTYGVNAFVERQINEFNKEYDSINQCFQKIYGTMDSKEKQAEQLGKCLGYLILNPIL